MDDQNNNDPVNSFTLNLDDVAATDESDASSTTVPSGVAIDEPPPSEYGGHGDSTVTNTETHAAEDFAPEAAYDGEAPTLALTSQSSAQYGDNPFGLPEYQNAMVIDAEYSNYEPMDGGGGGNKLMVTLILAIGFAVVAFLGLLVMEANSLGEDPITYVMASIGLSDAEPTGAFKQTARPRPRPKRKRAANPAVMQPRAGEIGVVPENPYWSLPNPVANRRDVDVRQWSSDERIIWKGGIKHKFTYQRYKTIQEVRAYQLKGSEDILWQGLKQKKFWTRMNALMGLAEIGVPVGVDLVEQTIGKARPSLIANYFKRFRRQRSPGELFVLRQAIKVVDARTRRVILSCLSRSRDALRDVYLVAATFDPGRGISVFAKRELMRLEVKQQRFDALQNYIKGTSELPEDMQLAVSGTTGQSGSDAAPPRVSTVDKIEYYGSVRSEPITDDGMVATNASENVVELSQEEVR